MQAVGTQYSVLAELPWGKWREETAGGGGKQAVLVTRVTSTGLRSDQYWLILVTSTASIGEQYWSQNASLLELGIEGYK